MKAEMHAKAEQDNEAVVDILAKGSFLSGSKIKSVMQHRPFCRTTQRANLRLQPPPSQTAGSSDRIFRSYHSCIA